MTLKLKKTICDVDLFVSNSLNQLIQNSFKTDGLLFPLSNNAACFMEKMNTNLIISFHVFLLLVLRLRRVFFNAQFALFSILIQVLTLKRLADVMRSRAREKNVTI